MYIVKPHSLARETGMPLTSSLQIRAVLLHLGFYSGLWEGVQRRAVGSGKAYQKVLMPSAHRRPMKDSLCGPGR